MIGKTKIIQLTLLSVGLALAVFTYFLYPTNNKDNFFKKETVEKKINLQENIKKLEEQEQTLINQILEEKKHLSSGGVLNKDTLENLQTNLQKTSSSLAEKRSDLKKKEKKINLQKKVITKLESEEKSLINLIQEEEKHLSSDDILKTQENIKKLEEQEQTLINQILEEKKHLSSGGVLDKDTLENLQTNLQKTSSSLAEKRSDLKKKERMIHNTIENLQTNLQKTSSSLAEKRSALKQEEMVIKTDEDKSNTFKKVTYSGFTSTLRPFTVEAETAYITAELSDIVFMTTMRVTLRLKDRTVTIRSDKGTYSKSNYDCTFVGHVVAEDGETTIVADNLDLINSKEFARVYNNVYLTNDYGFLKSDIVNYDFNTKVYTIRQFSSNEKVKAKLIQ